ncbi:hypothetical protein BJ508DRAFT_10087 [Ascobolus immersus RN42]|uniref:Uncharacterized protein n=1 Tax=Ascobolus immersus RN42 TaxID=1160509 RepID=A0A3N4HR64_ASCIM|nr:hypothetical protein BJ508DRAFT_10087 [Ascobolus immersus RN42]
MESPIIHTLDSPCATPYPDVDPRRRMSFTPLDSLPGAHYDLNQSLFHGGEPKIFPEHAFPPLPIIEDLNSFLHAHGLSTHTRWFEDPHYMNYVAEVGGMTHPLALVTSYGPSSPTELEKKNAVLRSSLLFLTDVNEVYAVTHEMGGKPIGTLVPDERCGYDFEKGGEMGREGDGVGERILEFCGFLLGGEE